MPSLTSTRSIRPRTFRPGAISTGSPASPTPNGSSRCRARTAVALGLAAQGAEQVELEPPHRGLDAGLLRRQLEVGLLVPAAPGAAGARRRKVLPRDAALASLLAQAGERRLEHRVGVRPRTMPLRVGHQLVRPQDVPTSHFTDSPRSSRARWRRQLAGGQASSTASEVRRAGGVSTRGARPPTARRDSSSVGASASDQVTSASERVAAAAPGANRSPTSSTKNDCDCGLPSSSLERRRASAAVPPASRAGRTGSARGRGGPRGREGAARWPARSSGGPRRRGRARATAPVGSSPSFMPPTNTAWKRRARIASG